MLDDETNAAVAAYKGTIPYSLYINDGVYRYISSVLATKRYGPHISHEDRRSYYWKKTYTYDPYPPGPKKTTPKERTPFKVSFFNEDSVIQMEESPPRRRYPLDLSPP